MAKPELGTKRVCVSCNTKFYDLARQPATCPKCGTEQPTEQPRLRRASGNLTEEKRRAKIIPVPGLEEPEAETETAGEEAEEDVLEDTSDLGEEEAEIVEVEQEPSEEER